eukprot:COSAG01_NODE_13818_length_1530_cov_8.299790_1_plen_67_part_00
MALQLQAELAGPRGGRAAAVRILGGAAAAQQADNTYWGIDFKKLILLHALNPKKSMGGGGANISNS